MWSLALNQRSTVILKLRCVPRYGLILSQKGASKTANIPRPSIFGDDSDEEVGVWFTLRPVRIFITSVFSDCGQSGQIIDRNPFCLAILFFSPDYGGGESAEGGSEEEDDETSKRRRKDC